MRPQEHPSFVDDEHLVESARNGQMGAFEELVARHRDKTYARALSLMRNDDDAMDVSQEAWVKSWQRLSQFHGESTFATWITRIVINLCMDHLRRSKLRRADSLDEMLEQPRGLERQMPVANGHPAARLERLELRERIDQALDKLSQEQRAALVLYEFEELEYKEIAKAMGCSVGTIMSRLYYARRKMAVLLADLRSEVSNDQLGFSI